MKLKYLISTSTAIAGLVASGSAMAQSTTFNSFVANDPRSSDFRYVDNVAIDGEPLTVANPTFDPNPGENFSPQADVELGTSSSNIGGPGGITTTTRNFEVPTFVTGVASYTQEGTDNGVFSQIADPFNNNTLNGSASQDQVVSATGEVEKKSTSSYQSVTTTNGTTGSSTINTIQVGSREEYALTGVGTTTVSDINVGGASTASIFVADAANNNYDAADGYSAYRTTGFDADTQTATIEQNTTTIGAHGASYTSHTGTASYAVSPVGVDGLTGLPVALGGVTVTIDEQVNQTLVTAAGVTTTGSLQAGNVSISGNTVSTGGNGDLVLHGGAHSTEVTLSDAGFAVTSARFARDADGNVILDGNGNPTYESTLTPTLTVSNEGEVTVYGQIHGVVAGTADTDAANVAQVNAGDAATLASANAYTDTSVAAEAALREDGDAATLASANAYTDAETNRATAAEAILSGQIAQEVTDRQAGDVATLASANSFTTTSVAAEAEARVAGDAATLASSKAYADAGDATTLASANSFTTSAVASEAAARVAGDAATLASAKSYTDNAVGAERNARVAADNLLRNQIASSTATAIALGGATILPDSNFTLSGNVGFYQGASALAVNAAARVSESAYITGAFGGGLNKNGQVGGRVGVVFGF